MNHRHDAAPHTAPDADLPGQWLSDLADGRLRDGALTAACRDWAADDEARRSWHAYHLIGDVLRSDDLARPAAADAAFVAAVRLRLAEEPTVLAPAPVNTRARRQVWLLPVAAAAGFVAVAGVFVVLQQSAPEAGGFAAPQMAASPPPALSVRAVSTVPLSATAAQAAGQMLRDARVDEYLRAHREVLSGSPAALPGGGVRTVDFDAAALR